MPRAKSQSPYLFGAVGVVVVGVLVWFVFFRGSSAPPSETPGESGKTKLELTQNSPAPAAKDATRDGNEAEPHPTPLKEKPDRFPIKDEHVVDDRQDDDLVRRVRILVRQRKLHAARNLIAASFLSPISDPDRRDLAQISIDLQRRLFNGGDTTDPETYTVQPGDSLWKIAKKFKSLHGGYGPILLLNRMNSPRSLLRMGQKLRVPKGTWSIVVDKSLFTLWLCYEGVPFRKYIVGIGKEERTPSGSFKVGEKTPNPAWYPPYDIVTDLRKRNVQIPVPYGHRENPLGSYWIALRHESYNGLGIHGNNAPKSLGTKSSLGCIRMDNKEVLMIAWTVYEGMTLTIVD